MPIDIDAKSFASKFPVFVGKEGSLVASHAARALGSAVGGKPANVPEQLGNVRDEFVNFGAGLIGYAELLGLKYGATSYQSRVDEGVTRGSRLDDAQFAGLKKAGFKSVVNLCMENDADTQRARAAGMSSLHLKIVDNTAPSLAQVKHFLDFVTKPANQPVYFHCEQGRGRTGIMAAAYRMAVQGWTPERALAEANGFKMGVPAQRKFILELGRALKAGELAGYPLPPR